MTPPKEVEQLVERFDRNKDQYTSGNYNEAQLRQEFVNPFFMALGWDIDNKQGFAEPYKEVIHEDAIKIGGATKAPDYCFRIGGTRKFFVEAKNPSINVRENIDPAYQLRRYAWSAKLPLSILTDFEEFAIYDCRLRPLKTDKSSTARIHYLTYADYIPQWETITSVFSKDAVLKGSFDKYAETTRGKKGTAEVDDAFLKEIESWRELLAKNIAVRNTRLSQPQLNFAVQRTIDRIIFLRICEDRGIELYGKLLSLVNGAKVYQRLTEQFYSADQKYNSGLFHFEQEKGRPEGVDELTPKLHIDDKPLIEIISKLYYPDCPYEFSVLPADILGQVYEQFLGKVIRLTAGHQAKIEDKPEVKKAGGVYYTPTYIVDYIVKNTVGRLLQPSSTEESLENQTSSPPHSRGGDPEGVAKQDVGSVLTTPNPPPFKAGGGVMVGGVGKTKTLTPKEAGKLRILDPACGSGSFLIGAYQYLLDWHRDWYLNNDPAKYTSGKNAALFKGPGGDWRLTTGERKRILLNNIYGVDIDSQAVEVTKLSLLLKVLEGENEQTINQQLKMFHERALPDLGNNIKCGNSLIGPDFYEGKQLSLLDDEEKNRINVFDWKKEFKETMDAGGFDAVIGNPPYIRIQAMKEWAPIEVEFYKIAYRSASVGNYDIYVVFLERGLSFLNRKGLLGYILPNKFFNSEYGASLRSIIADGMHLKSVVHFGDQQVFSSVTTYTALVFLSKEKVAQPHFFRVTDLQAWNVGGLAETGQLDASTLSDSPWNFFVGPGKNVVERLESNPDKLKDISDIFVGLQTDADDIFILEEMRLDRNRVLCHSLSTGKDHWFEDHHLKAFLKGSLNIRRYEFTDVNKRLIFPYETLEGKSVLIQPADYKKRFPLTWKYLEDNKERLAKRNKGKMGENWHGYVYKKNHTKFEFPKILVPSLAKGSCFSI